jgi:hypothetical protein
MYRGRSARCRAFVDGVAVDANHKAAVLKLFPVARLASNGARAMQTRGLADSGLHSSLSCSGLDFAKEARICPRPP